MKHVAALAGLALLLAAGPANAELWVWTDADGAERWTDDPAAVPPEQASSLRRADVADDAADSSYSTIDSRNVAPPERTEADVRADVLRLEQRRLLEQEQAELRAEVEGLQREATHAANEVRKYRVGGRVGAAERAVAAEARSKDLSARLASKRRALEAVRGRLELLRER